MATDPERLRELLARQALHQARGEELRRTMVRAHSWNQLFETEEEAQTGFLGLVKRSLSYDKGNGIPCDYRIGPDPNGDIHLLIRGGIRQGQTISFQRLTSGDVKLVIAGPDVTPFIQHIIPSIGSINHPFTSTNTVAPSSRILWAERERMRAEGKLDQTTLDLLFSPGFHQGILGEVATQGIEDVFLISGQLPDRIGYNIYDHNVLVVQSKLAAAYPELIPKPHQRQVEGFG